MRKGVYNMQHTIASLRQSQTMDVDTHLLCRNQRCDDRSTKSVPPSLRLATDSRGLETDRQSVAYMI